jgi:hypothetical protein
MDTRHIIGGLSVGFIIMLPIIRFYQRNNWSKTQNLIGILGIAFIWFLTQGALHELCHIIGVKLVGANIEDYRLFPKFWEGDFDFGTAYISCEGDVTIGQKFVIAAFPYFRDLIIVIIGFFILKAKKIRHYFLVGLIFSMFMLNSVFDIVTNFVGLFMKFGDFSDLTKMIGNFWTYFIGISIMAVTAFLTYRIFMNYKGFPEKIKDES